MARMWDKIQRTWCRVMHPDPMWPVNGKYRCPACLREYPVPWEEDLRPRRRSAPSSSPAVLRPEVKPAGLALVGGLGRQAAA